MIREYCVLRNRNLPLFPCGEKGCEWYCHSDTFNNCFWVIAQLMADKLIDNFTFEEIAELENITEEEAKEIFDQAISKCRNEFLDFVVERQEDE